MTTMNRRELLKLTAAGAVAVGTGALGVQVLTVSGSQAAVDTSVTTGERFDETYRAAASRAPAYPPGGPAHLPRAAPARPCPTSSSTAPRCT